jgi:hypothetical protein
MRIVCAPFAANRSMAGAFIMPPLLTLPAVHPRTSSLAWTISSPAAPMACILVSLCWTWGCCTSVKAFGSSAHFFSRRAWVLWGQLLSFGHLLIKPSLKLRSHEGWPSMGWGAAGERHWSNACVSSFKLVYADPARPRLAVRELRLICLRHHRRLGVANGLHRGVEQGLPCPAA